MEEIEKNKDKIENCQKNAKAYIDSVKVCTDIFTFTKEFKLLSGSTNVFLSYFF